MATNLTAHHAATGMAATFDIFLVAIPGLERTLEEEARAQGFRVVNREAGGVTVRGAWPDVWRANLVLRGASRVLARIGSFRASHLAQLDKRARAFPWGDVLRKDVPVSVEASCRKSKIYHSGAAAQRIATAIHEELGAPIGDDAAVAIKLRIEKDVCTLSVDTSGGLLHKRGSKQAMAKAPLRETMAALLLRECGYSGSEPVLDPMCGSGTFVIEAAEWAAGLPPGRNRNFAFEHLATFDPSAWQRLKSASPGPRNSELLFFGSDRDAGAIAASQANASRAGVSEITRFVQRAVSDITTPEGAPGLVMINPPYGLRIGNKTALLDLYAALGRILLERFSGWRVGLFTPDETLARATGLPFKAKPLMVNHGGLRVRLWRSETLS
jgi:putative N6-adenine-specific DNA methylase